MSASSDAAATLVLSLIPLLGLLAVWFGASRYFFDGFPRRIFVRRSVPIMALILLILIAETFFDINPAELLPGLEYIGAGLLAVAWAQFLVWRFWCTPRFGPIVMDVSRRASRRQDLWLSLALLGLGGVNIAVQLGMRAPRPVWLATPVTSIVTAITLISAGVYVLLLFRRVDIRREGIVLYGYPVRWSRIEGFTWARGRSWHVLGLELRGLSVATFSPVFVQIDSCFVESVTAVLESKGLSERA